ncbi:hypothetical protein CEUSTIGMA_g12260.t1 [Chlamydomonas eustigma]|uniref:Uncharacterized protein n=1 Tax=Chlamydomonas eustigma TaxID=1157962 RepID=A0A250XPG4_9CHLO|nr:hypothetical protein CEUSTIGMA_g12260.t1 [Chlamydomonas eustigma]|eukprot:GAX84839.1 hypothetical protein CEUSTIGMA_g12260.t1 [Chlamydomonas eustigma]
MPTLHHTSSISKTPKTFTDTHVDSINRRGVLGLTAVIVSSAPKAALAFGSGFPGYDMNLDGRKRALERNKRELELERQKAAAYRAAKAAKAAAATTPAANVDVKS